MGESSLQMWTAFPEMTTVEHPYAIAKGTNFVDVTVDKDNGPLQDAWVTIWMGDEIFESGYTNAEGFIRLPISSVETGEVLAPLPRRIITHIKIYFKFMIPV